MPQPWRLSSAMIRAVLAGASRPNHVPVTSMPCWRKAAHRAGRALPAAMPSGFQGSDQRAPRGCRASNIALHRAAPPPSPGCRRRKACAPSCRSRPEQSGGKMRPAARAVRGTELPGRALRWATSSSAELTGSAGSRPGCSGSSRSGDRGDVRCGLRACGRARIGGERNAGEQQRVGRRPARSPPRRCRYWSRLRGG